MKWSREIEPKPEGFAENSGSDSFQIAMQPLNRSLGQGRHGADNTEASRFLLLALQELVNRFADQP